MVGFKNLLFWQYPDWKVAREKVFLQFLQKKRAMVFLSDFRTKMPKGRIFEGSALQCGQCLDMPRSKSKCHAILVSYAHR